MTAFVKAHKQATTHHGDLPDMPTFVDGRRNNATTTVASIVVWRAVVPLAALRRRRPCWRQNPSDSTSYLHDRGPSRGLLPCPRCYDIVLTPSVSPQMQNHMAAFHSFGAPSTVGGRSFCYSGDSRPSTIANPSTQILPSYHVGPLRSRQILRAFNSRA